MPAPQLAMPRVFSSALKSIMVQVISFGLYLAIQEQIGPLPLVACSLLALLVAKIVALSLPWQIINTILPIALVWGLTHSLPEWAYLAIAGSLVALFLPALFSQVPFFPTSPQVFTALCKQLPENLPFKFIDLGCGFGQPIFSLALQRPNGKFVGIDVSPLSVLVAWIRSLSYPNVTIRFANIWKHPLSDYDFVYAFLAPPPMPALGEKLLKEPRDGRLILSNTFPIPAWKGHEVSTGDDRQHTIYVYQA